MAQKMSIPDCYLEEYIEGFADLHGVTYKKKVGEDFSDFIGDMSDVKAGLDRVSLTMMELRRSGVISVNEADDLHDSYLREKLRSSGKFIDFRVITKNGPAAVRRAVEEAQKLGLPAVGWCEEKECVVLNYADGRVEYKLTERIASKSTKHKTIH